MKQRILPLCLMMILLSATVLAAPINQDFRGYEVTRDRTATLTNADHSGFAKSGVDTFCMLSHTGSPAGDAAESYSPGPDNLYAGDFQDDFGLKNWDDWSCVDYTQRTDPIWHIDTYHAVNGSYSYWCGENYPSCGGGDPAGGYGNSYEEFLDYWAEVGNPDLVTHLTLTATINYDNEPGYDYLYLQYENNYGMQNEFIYNGIGTGVAVYAPLVFDSDDYVPHPDSGNPSCHLRWCATSDGAWSDEDCDYPTTGLAQIDDILVSGDNGIVTAFEDCEDQVEDVWRVTFPPGVGAFCWVWPLLDELDECCLNRTPQVAFIDDGNVVPGTGGYFGMSWTYGPGGFVVNPEGGLAGPDFDLHNEIWSPVLEWAGGAPGYDGAFIEFSVYRHNGLGPVWGMIFYIWHVRSTTSDNPADITDEPWRDRNLVYYGGPECTRHQFVVSDLLQPGSKYVQMALGVYQLWCWGWCLGDVSPAPYYDDARFCAFQFHGPAISTREIDIAQDDFPENGELNCADPCGMNVRFDMARDISLQNEPYIQPGDSIIFDIVALRTGTELAAMPELCYRLDPNPLFDFCRTAIPAGDGNTSYRGNTPGDSARITGPDGGDAVPDRFCFDLPDSGFFYPGDQIHYYIRATDSGDGTATLPGDTTGFSHYPGTGDPDYIQLRYPSSYIVRALPSIQDLASCAQTTVLWWNDFAGNGLEPEWMNAWRSVGFEERTDFDIYYTNGPSSGVGNGLGGRATSAQLLGYDLVAYSAGDLDQFTISNVDYEDDGGDDIGVLAGWFDTGDRCMFLTGNGLVDDLNNRTAETIAWEDRYIQVHLVDNKHNELLAQWNPAVQRDPNDPTNPLFACATRWMTGGFCTPRVQHFDLVNAEGTPGRVAEFLTRDCVAGQYPYAAAVYNTVFDGVEGGQVVYLPYDLGYVAHDSQCGGNTGSCSDSPVACEILRDVLQACEYSTGYSTTAAPEADIFHVNANYPNPFNPSTRIEYTMPQRGQLTISIYNVRGEMVKQLLDEVVESGPGFVVWDGTNHSGTAVSSGVYFYKTTALDKTTIQKMALVR
ncbi:MAG: FlgD immunoglobulin-like domain containing protein [bacterium]